MITASSKQASPQLGLGEEVEDGVGFPLFSVSNSLQEKQNVFCTSTFHLKSACQDVINVPDEDDNMRSKSSLNLQLLLISKNKTVTNC